MRAMVLEEPGPLAPGLLREAEVSVPEPGAGEVLVRVSACGVCRTDLHVVEGELPEPRLPLVLGHQVVGTVEQLGKEVRDVALGTRVGIGWLGGTDGTCPYCRNGRENLCDSPTFTGYSVDGGYAEYARARSDFLLALPEDYPDLQAAPLLCAGLIGYRALKLAEVEGLDGATPRLGLYGFGASAHIVIQVAVHLGHEVHVVTRGEESRQFAMELGAASAVGPEEAPPELDSAIIFAPAGALVPAALAAVRKGGLVVCAGIHMSPIPEFSYDLLWGERILRSVANLTRADGHEFLDLAPQVPVQTNVEQFRLEEAGEALTRLKSGTLRGAAVLVP